MRHRWLVLFAFAVACRSSSSTPAPDAAATKTPTFEGDIDLAMAPFFIVQTKVKGNKSRVTFRKGPRQIVGELFVDGDANKLYTPLAGGRKYAELDLAAATPQKPLTATSTGKKEMVLGHECEILSVIDGPNRREICLARDLPPMRINIGPTSDGQGFQPSFGEGFPLRIVIYDATNAEVGKLEAVRIEAKAESASDVEIPSGVEKVPIGADGGVTR